jgi:hypothetical protein
MLAECSDPDSSPDNWTLLGICRSLVRVLAEAQRRGSHRVKREVSCHKSCHEMTRGIRLVEWVLREASDKVFLCATDC